MHHATSNAAARIEKTGHSTSNALSSPRRPVYYVQSPSRDSHDGEKSTSIHSSPPGSPAHSQSSLGRHSRDSSYSQFSGALKPGSRKVSPSDASAGVAAAAAARGRNVDVAWKDAIEEEGLLEGEKAERGPSRRCYVLAFMAASLALFFFFALILWGVSHDKKPVVTMRSITFEHFNIHAGTDASLMPNYIATLRSTLKFTYRNTGSFFGVHVATGTPIKLLYYQLTMATGDIRRFYQSRKSERDVSVVVSGSRVPLYGGGAGLSSQPGNNSAPVNLTLDFTLRSQAYVLGKLVKPVFLNDVRCLAVLDPNKIGEALSLKSSCQYN